MLILSDVTNERRVAFCDLDVIYEYSELVVYAVVTCEIGLFQNYFTDLLQLMNIFQHVQCR